VGPDIEQSLQGRSAAIDDKAEFTPRCGRRNESRLLLIDVGVLHRLVNKLETFGRVTSKRLFVAVYDFYFYRHR
jgi:hypothetical protein